MVSMPLTQRRHWRQYLGSEGGGTEMAQAAESIDLSDHLRRTTVRIPEHLHDAVDAVAKASGISFNAAVTDALVDFVSSEHRRARVDQFFREGQERFHALLDKLSS
jgi:predicted transcriptional regulator